MKTILSLLLFFFSITAFSQAADTVTATGTIIKKSFTTKAGQKIDNTVDYYFKSDEQEFFIMLSESDTIVRDAVLKNIGKKVKLNYTVANGNWDNVEIGLEENLQSRVGNYIVILKIDNVQFEGE